MKLAPLQEAFRDHETGPITGQAGLCRVYQRFTGLSRRLFIVMPPNLGNAAADSAASLLAFFSPLSSSFFFLKPSLFLHIPYLHSLSHISRSHFSFPQIYQISPSNTLPPAQPPPLLNKYRLALPTLLGSDGTGSVKFLPFANSPSNSIILSFSSQPSFSPLPIPPPPPQPS